MNNLELIISLNQNFAVSLSEKISIEQVRFQLSEYINNLKKRF